MIRRIFPFALAIALLPALTAEATAQLRPGIHLARANDAFDEGANGVGASLELSFPVLPVDLFVAGDYFFPDCDGCSFWGGSADVHFSLPIPFLSPYATGGVVLRNTEMGDTSERTGGVGLGAGINLGAIGIGAYAEGRYEIMDGASDQLVFRVGARF